MTGNTTNVPLTAWNADTVRATALAYRRCMAGGLTDSPFGKVGAFNGR
jgi:hypothetical protein